MSGKGIVFDQVGQRIVSIDIVFGPYKDLVTPQAKADPIFTKRRGHEIVEQLTQHLLRFHIAQGQYRCG